LQKHTSGNPRTRFWGSSGAGYTAGSCQVAEKKSLGKCVVCNGSPKGDDWRAGKEEEEVDFGVNRVSRTALYLGDWRKEYAARGKGARKMHLREEKIGNWPEKGLERCSGSVPGENRVRLRDNRKKVAGREEKTAGRR